MIGFQLQVVYHNKLFTYPAISPELPQVDPASLSGRKAVDARIDGIPLNTDIGDVKINAGHIDVGIIHSIFHNRFIPILVMEPDAG